MALTVSVSLSTKTETTITMKWSANSAIVQVKYRYKAGSGSWSAYTTKTVSAKSGTFKISSLSANTSYTIEYDIRSSSEGVSGTSTVKTYNWPYVKSCPTFSAYNEGLELEFTNPLERSCSLKIKVGNTVVYSDTDVVGNIAFSPGWFDSDMLPLIPNSYSGTYTVEVTYSGHTMSKTGTFTSEGANPTITFVGYADTNSTAQAIIQDTSKILQNVSTPRFLVSGTALYGASIASADVTILNATSSGTASGGTATVNCSAVNSASDVTALVVLFDSRGNSAATRVTLSMMGYESPSAIITLARQNNFYSETDLTVDADVASIGSNAPTINAQYSEHGLNTWSNWAGQATLSDNTLYTQSLDNTKEWDVKVTVTDSFNVTTTYTGLFVGVGLPIMFIDRALRAVGINVFPDTAGEFAIKPIVEGDLDGEQLTDTSLSSGTTITNIGDFDLPKGVWDVRVVCRFGNNSSGRRFMCLSNANNTNAFGWDQQNVPAAPDGYTYTEIRTWIKATADMTVYVNGFQNSGSTLSVRTWYAAVKIGHI